MAKMSPTDTQLLSSLELTNANWTLSVDSHQGPNIPVAALSGSRRAKKLLSFTLFSSLKGA